MSRYMQHANVTLHFGLDEVYFDEKKYLREFEMIVCVILSVKMCKFAMHVE